MTRSFDLIVVGAGTGLDVVSWAVGQGWRVALVEKGPPGGTCLVRGCIPSKMLIHSADVARTLRRAPLFGIHVDGWSVDFPGMMKRVRDHVDGESDRIREALRRRDDPAYFEGEARFVGPRRLRVGDDEIEGERVVLATGARPRIPPLDGLQDVPFLTSTEALDFDHLPESMIVLGGGYIAAEMGHFYGALGTRVTIVQRHGVMLAKEDDDVASTFTRAFARDHEVILDAEAVRVRREDGGVAVDVVQPSTGQRRTLRAEQLLVAVGITPNSDTLDLHRTGVRVDGRGYVHADLTLRTDAEGIWALGDAVGRFAFKHNANHEARYLIQNMVHPDDPVEVDYHAMPHAVFSAPQVAGVGCTEQEARAAGIAYEVARYAYKDTAMGRALDEEDGFVKFVVEPRDGRILGCHIVGPDASTLIHEVLVAMRSGSNRLDDLAETVHIHPALSEVVQRASTARRA